MRADDDGLPPELADRFTRPFARFLKIESLTGIVLLVAVVAAMVVASSPWSGPSMRLWETSVGFHFGSHGFSRSLRHCINDGLMTLFFFVVALELKRELVHGELRDLRTAAFSLAGAVGGMFVPAALYLSIMGSRPGAHGWGIVMATDTAFVIGALALLGSRVPASLRLFLLSLAIFDDIGAIAVVAIGYGGPLRVWPLGVVAVVVAVVFAAARAGVRGVLVYASLGAALWLALDASGISPTLAGVILGLMTPARVWVSDERLHAIFHRVFTSRREEHPSGDPSYRADLKRAGVAAKEALSPAERLELRLHPWSGFVIMPLFAFANAGTRISWGEIGDPITGAIIVGLAVGKPMGVIGLTWVATRVGLATRPLGLDWSLIVGGALLTGIGFTMSLFIAGLAFDPESLQAAKIGIFGASIVSGVAGISTLAYLTSPRRSRP